MIEMNSLEDVAFVTLDPVARARVLAQNQQQSIPEIIHARNILAIDTGTDTGYAYRTRDGLIRYGTERFAQTRRPGQRWHRYRAWLSRMIVDNHIHVLAYETVMFGHGGQKSGRAGDVYGAWKCLIEMAADAHNLDLICAAPATVKKAVTGTGRAKKEDVIAEVLRRGFRPDSDNAADALAILSWAAMQEDC